MALDLDTMATQLRAAVGSPKTSEISADEIKQYIAEAVIEFQGTVPDNDMEERETVADTSDYDMDANVIQIYDVYRRNTSVVSLDDELVVSPEQAVVTEIYRKPSQYYAHLLASAYVGELVARDFVYDRPTHTLKLIPCPDTAEKIVILFAREWTNSRLTEEMVEIVRDFAKARCCDHLLARRADTMGFRRMGGGVVYVKEPLIRIRDEAVKRAKEKLEIMSLQQEVW